MEHEETNRLQQASGPVLQWLHYLKFQKRYSPHTVLSYQTDLEQLQAFMSMQGYSDLLGLRPILLRSWVIHLSEQQLEARSISRKVAAVRSFYKFHHGQGNISQLPTLFLRSPKLPKRNPSFIPESNMAAILGEVAQSGNSQIEQAAVDSSETDTDELTPYRTLRKRLVLELFYTTGMRLAELVGLKDRDISHASGTVSILGKRSKQRIVPLLPEVLKLIKEYQAERNRMLALHQEGYLLLTDKGEQLYPMWVQRLVKEAMKQGSTLEKKSPHVLRHTFATHLLNQGADLMAIKEMMGHSSLAATQVYTHNAMAEMKVAYDKAHPKGKRNQDS